ncbi:plasmepsin-2 [Clonorchis sinensis]|uniref:Plasmepsin-2 n=1 Tax=Clonorchis sinensis TaxID=79923 RepID=A0A3R7CNH4_CLOSI|nr:plasmepsin-2 [Clonorchis sinensis]
MYHGSLVTGKVVKDHMSIDGTPIGIVPFGVAENAPPPKEGSEISGALALAKMSEQPDIPTILDVMLANKAIETSIFTLYFTWDCAPGGPDAQVNFGEIDPNLYNEPISYVQLVPSFKWQIMLQRLDIGDIPLLTNVLLEIDTKMPAIMGPIEQVQKINIGLGFHNNERGIYAKPCWLVHEQRDLVLVFSNFALPTSSEFYMRQVSFL